MDQLQTGSLRGAYENFSRNLFWLFCYNRFAHLGNCTILFLPTLFLRGAPLTRVVMFHVKHRCQKILDLLNFLARGRQCESEVPKLWCTPRHFTPISAYCQVFFAGVGQVIHNLTGLLARPRQLYSSRTTVSSTFYGKGANKSKAKSPPAPIIQ